MTDTKDNSEIVKTIVTLAHNLGMKVIAEGVETAEQAEQLRTLGCEYGQGYLFSRPISQSKVLELLEREARGSMNVGFVDELTEEPVLTNYQM
jgi:EAL domain-containing protein (putative c-di-GMP-specific phosphodiesterase class I)